MHFGHINQGLFTIAASRRRETTEYGVLHVDEKNILRGFEEKPESTYLVSMGVYMVSREVLAVVPRGQKYGFDSLMNDLLARGSAVRVKPHDGYWLDIGRPDDYMKAIEDFENDRHRLLFS